MSQGTVLLPYVDAMACLLRPEEVETPRQKRYCVWFHCYMELDLLEPLLYFVHLTDIWDVIDCIS